MTAFEWTASSDPHTPSPEFYCPTSDVWQGRFVKMGPLLVRKNFEANTVALFTGTIGEVGDNCFTHNAPGWVDVSGCWFEYHLDGAVFSCMIADRGRGILASLQAARPSLTSHRNALQVALTERGVSGRLPEQRGNGLKFVTDALSKMLSGSFLLQSGDAAFRCDLPLDLTQIGVYIRNTESAIRGTYCEVKVRLPYAS